MTTALASQDAPTRLARRLRLFDAVVIGLGAMIGAGVFAAFGPAAQAAGSGVLLALAIAAVVAFCNAVSSAQLAALYPASGGTYVYGWKRLGHFWGFLAGFGFVIGKLASCGAMALTFGAYAWPSLMRPVAAGAVVALVGINLLGVQKTAWATRAILAVVLGALTVAVAAALTGPRSAPAELWSWGEGGAYGTLQAAGFLFFAFAGYARIATLGEEVVDPAKTIPRAIPLALGITVVLYAAVAASLLLTIGPGGMAASKAPLAAAVEASRYPDLGVVVRAGAAVASLGVLLSLIAGVSRTMFAMSSEGDLPRALAAVHPVRKVPHVAEALVGAVVVAVVLAFDVRLAIGFSSFAVLVYYAVANASALTLSAQERRWPRAIPALGVVGCLAVAATLPAASVLPGLGLFAVAAALFAWKQRR